MRKLVLGKSIYTRFNQRYTLQSTDFSEVWWVRKVGLLVKNPTSAKHKKPHPVRDVVF